MKELYTAPEFTVIRFTTEDAITVSYSGDNNIDIEDLISGGKNAWFTLRDGFSSRGIEKRAECMRSSRRDFLGTIKG